MELNNEHQRSKFSRLLEAVLLPLVEEVRLRTSQIDDFRASVTILLHDGALLAVVRVADALSTANNAASLKPRIIILS